MSENFILLVEDNYNDELLTRRAFKKNHLDHQLVVVHDGVEALDFLLGPDAQTMRNPTGQPSLILLDLKLPKIDGLEVLKQLRANKHTRSLPIVVLTSSDEEEDVNTSLRLGVNNYLRKPVDFNEFVEIIRQLGLSWLNFNATISHKWKEPPRETPPH